MLTRTDYYRLQNELRAVEAKVGVDLVDEICDQENTYDAGVTEADDNYWELMVISACMAAGFRAEESGIKLNELMGRPIY
jgi:hypothetical protein